MEKTRLTAATTGARHPFGWKHTAAAEILTRYLRFAAPGYLKLSDLTLDAYPKPIAGHKYVLYAHVPFCESLCPYCSFNRFMFNEERAAHYFHNLRAEMRLVAGLGYRFESMYIGGGTPTILVDELVETIDLAKQLFGIREVSCETNPNHLTAEVLGKLAGRVDRLSVGVQSFDDDLLKQMSRFEKFGSGAQVLENIRGAVGKLPSINVDMIFNFPSQTEAILRKDIETVIASGANQVTFYPLMSAPSVKRAMDRSIGTVEYSREAEFYKIITEELQKAYVPMSAWTFSRKGDGMIDEYIVEYEEYVGVGSGSFSYLDGTLLVNTFSLAEYDKMVNAGEHPVKKMRMFNKQLRMRYRFMMELFDLKLNREKFRQDFGLPVWLGLWLESLFFSLVGAFDFTNRSWLKLNPRSRYLMVVMMREFFAGVNLLRDQARTALAPHERLMCNIGEKVEKVMT